MWSAQFLNVLPNHWLSSSGLGTMGYGLPAAFGAKLNERDCMCMGQSYKIGVVVSMDSILDFNARRIAHGA